MPARAAELPPAPSGLPLADEIMSPGGTPELRLELHVYSDRPEQRFVFINSRKYREGEVLQEGPSVEQIRADGVVLNQQGRRFLLPRD
jgi:general secretion pathway protein B